MRPALWLLALTLLLGVPAACSPPGGATQQAGPPAGATVLRGAGATFPLILYRQWFSTYQHDHPGTVVTYDAVGSGEGIRRFIGRNTKEEERVDFGASDAAMTDADMALVDRGALLLPVTAGSVVLAYNLPGIQGDLKLSRAAYVGIFLGEIKNWNDPAIARTNPGVKLPRLTIAMVVRQDRSGTTFAFTNHLSAVSGKWRARYGAATHVNWPGNAMRATGNEGVAGRISHSIGSIGYVGYEFARRLGLNTAVIENREGKFVKPTTESCTTALAGAPMPENLRVFIPDPAGLGSYPLVTFTWVLLYKKYDAAKGAAIRDLFRWCLREGQGYAPQMGYVPLPEGVATKAAAALDGLTIAERP
jgi:phosphate transport system substrate-binding protein